MSLAARMMPDRDLAGEGEDGVLVAVHIVSVVVHNAHYVRAGCHPLPARAIGYRCPVRPLAAAHAAASARLRTPSLASTLLTWWEAVLRLM